MKSLRLVFFALWCLSGLLRAQESNPAAAGFNKSASDPEAIAIADQVMQAMGGRTAWNNTRYIYWNFFGSRQLLWDKFTGNVRIDIPKENTVLQIHLHSNTGKAMVRGQVMTEPDSIAYYLDRAKSIWINDSYWLVMPFKMKDSGVTLKYLGKGNTEEGAKADIVQLTFEEVGRTPDNKYHVYVEETSRLVTQWKFLKTIRTPHLVSPPLERLCSVW
ncbi:MAG: hypothetical protein R2795_26775 [Saprospiraceae bacterium]